MSYIRLFVTALLLGALLTSLASGQSRTKTPWNKAERVDQLDQGEATSVKSRLKSTNAESAVNLIPTVPTEPLPFAVPLSGTYTIGAAGDFINFEAAVAALNTLGVSAPVTFEFEDAGVNQSARVVIGAIPNSTSLRPVTFKPQAGKAVTLEMEGSYLDGKGISFSGATYVTFDGVGFGATSLTVTWRAASSFPSGDPYGSTFYLGGTGTSRITLKNMTILGRMDAVAYDDATDLRSAIYLNNLAGAVNNVTIDNNKIIKAHHAIYSMNAAASTTPTNLRITNNTIGLAGGDYVAEGIAINRADSATITGNTLSGMKYNEAIYYTYSGLTGPSGAYFVYAFVGASLNGSSVIGKNTIYDYELVVGDNDDPNISGFVTYTFRATGRSTTSRPVISNNTISKFTSDDIHNTVWGTRAQNVIMYHNSFNWAGTMGGVGMPAMVLKVGGAVNTVFNNIFYAPIFGTEGVAQYTYESGGAQAAGSAWNNNVVDAPGFDFIGYRSDSTLGTGSDAAIGQDQQSVNGNPYYTSDANLMPLVAAFSAADGVGKSGIPVTTDKAGTARDTTLAGKRDAGAYEFTPSSPFLEDVKVVSIDQPSTSGAVQGFVSTVKVHVLNTRPTPVTYTINVTIGGGATPYTDTKTGISLVAFKDSILTFATWTPLTGVSGTITATASADDELGNNVVSRAQPVVPVLAFGAYSECFNGGAAGWVGTEDWVLSSTFTKLEGPYDGSSWVTKETGQYTSSGVGNELLSPYFNFTTHPTGDVYVSFYHSLKTEPSWDRSQFQYSIDTGKTWVNVGVLNDPAPAVNWYNTSIYKNAAYNINCFDSVSADAVGFSIGAAWTSNGTCDVGQGFGTSGPEGWVFVANKLPAAVNGKPMVRFRYFAFSDAATADDGWAFDCFTMSTTAPSFAGTLSGQKWRDANGNGVNDAELFESGVKIDLQYFGVHLAYDTTDVTGAYSFAIKAPGIYTVYAVDSLAKTFPAAGFHTVDHDGNAAVTGQNIGDYDGSISGYKWDDKDDDAIKDAGEPGIEGWVIQVHTDSVDGDIVYSGEVETNASGFYRVPVPPGTYYVTEAEDEGYRQKFPPGGYHTVTVSGASGSGTAKYQNKNFGNFELATLRISLTIDVNGNGVKDGTDFVALPSGAASQFTMTKYGIPVTGSPFTLGNTIPTTTVTHLDTGTYVVSEVAQIPGWRRTKNGTAGTYTFTVLQSGVDTTAFYMDYKMIVVTGNKFEDLDGDGVKDGGEPGLAGWTVNISGGTYYGGTSAVTDGSGNYSIDSVGYAVLHTVSEVTQAGWTRTFPGGAGTYTFEGKSGNLINTTGQDFGNFHNTTVSGFAYRDYNGNGVMDPGDVPYTGLELKRVNGVKDTSDGTGYSFTGVITVDTIRVVAVPSGYTLTQPVGGEYPIALSSGGAATLKHFGLFQTSDSAAKYRTFTASQLGADDQKKPGKRPKAGKAYDPVKNKPNTANLVDDLIGKTGQAIGSIRVGISGQTNLGGKTKAYVVPNKQSAFWASLNNKSVRHTGIARGFDQDLKGKPFLKLQKSFGPNKKQNNRLFANLLALKLNLSASGLKTPANLGTLLYYDPLSSFNGWTIDDIADYADTVMTNFEFVPLSVYTELDTVALRIDTAFFNAATDDTSAGWAAPKLMWTAYKSVNQVPYLKPNPGATPKNRRDETVEAVPTAFALEQNYPNPFNPTTTIEFDLPEASIVTLKVYNLLGQEVATLFDREEIELNETVEFDASSLPSGVYLYRIVAETIADEDAGIAAETFTQVKKMVLVK